MRRPYYLDKISTLTAQFPAVCLLGPRQVGKTTLAQTYADHLSSHTPMHLFDLEKAEDVNILSQPHLALASLEGLIIIDEIQQRPDLFPALRVLIDHQQKKQSWLLLGSASRDLLQQNSETLAGRIAYLEISPFDFTETKEETLLWLRGGFPKAYLAADEAASYEWRRQYVKTFLEQDIPNLGIRIAPLNLRRFWMMLAHYHGNIFNAEELSRALNLNNKSIRHYLDILTDTFMIRQLQPWWENISKRQVKSPKIYFRDSGLLHYLLDIETEALLQRHPKLGASWEGFALEEIIRCRRFEAENCYFWATHAQAELDLLVFHQGKRLGFEFKYSDAPKLTKSMHIACEDLHLDELFIITPTAKTYHLADNIKVMSLRDYALS
ncbi:MAG TPA: ATP-binding protein [Gammaproteobacteria bacterium]|nr:ATP-binding protein [Gammaproteobacteria bacterium]